VVALPALPEEAGLAAWVASPVHRLQQSLLALLREWGPLAVLLPASAQIPQASQYSGSLFRQPLISFLILIFRMEGVEQSRYKNKEFKHMRWGKSTGHLAGFRRTFTLYKPRNHRRSTDLAAYYRAVMSTEPEEKNGADLWRIHPGFLERLFGGILVRIVGGVILLGLGWALGVSPRILGWGLLVLLLAGLGVAALISRIRQDRATPVLEVAEPICESCRKPIALLAIGTCTQCGHRRSSVD
jgi:hypothetical protein